MHTIQSSPVEFSSVKHGMAWHANNRSKAGSFSWNPFDEWYICAENVHSKFILFTKFNFYWSPIFPFFSISFLAYRCDHLWVEFSFAYVRHRSKRLVCSIDTASTITLARIYGYWPVYVLKRVAVCVCVWGVWNPSRRALFITLWPSIHKSFFRCWYFSTSSPTASFSTLVGVFSSSSSSPLKRRISAKWNAKITYENFQRAV